MPRKIIRLALDPSLKALIPPLFIEKMQWGGGRHLAPAPPGSAGVLPVQETTRGAAGLGEVGEATAGRSCCAGMWLSLGMPELLGFFPQGNEDFKVNPQNFKNSNIFTTQCGSSKARAGLFFATSLYLKPVEAAWNHFWNEAFIIPMGHEPQSLFDTIVAHRGERAARSGWWLPVTE